MSTETDLYRNFKLIINFIYLDNFYKIIFDEIPTPDSVTALVFELEDSGIDLIKIGLWEYLESNKLMFNKFFIEHKSKFSSRELRNIGKLFGYLLYP